MKTPGYVLKSRIFYSSNEHFCYTIVYSHLSAISQNQTCSQVMYKTLVRIYNYGTI